MPPNSSSFERIYQTMTELTFYTLKLGLATINPPAFQMHTTVPYQVCYPAGTVWFRSQDQDRPGYIVRMPYDVFVREISLGRRGWMLIWGITPQEKSQIDHAAPVNPDEAPVFPQG